MTNTTGDFRLYTYGGYGNLEKVGDLKTDSHGVRRKHFFKTLEEVRERIKVLREINKWYKNSQFIIIQYGDDVTDSSKLNSKIIEIYNP